MKKHEPKYIEVEGIMRACYDSFLKTGNKAYSEIITLADAVPAADVEEVRHGRYEQHDDPLYAKGGYWECSCCKWRISNLIFIEDVNYCPNCGAKMDEVTELKPCPFCGGEATLVDYWFKGVANKKHYFVQCKPCGVRKDNHHSGYNSASKAIQAWNKRANGGKTDEVEE